MKKIVTVSGGVDSMTLLDMCVKKYGRDEIVVAHFDHATRSSSETDRVFVQNFCQTQNIKFVYERVKRDMSEHLSEEKARELRYNFFTQVREKYGCDEIMVAQHLDDLVESVAINLLRGTGWRGLSVMNSEGVERPFLTGEFGRVYDRREILRYAGKNGVCYRQDPTNNEDTYLRNRVRQLTFDLPREVKERFLTLRNEQCEIGVEVEKLAEVVIGELVGNEMWRGIPGVLAVPRGVFEEMSDEVATEVLDRLVRERLGLKCTRLQMRDFLKAVREYAPGKVFNLPKDKLVKMGRGYFIV